LLENFATTATATAKKVDRKIVKPEVAKKRRNCQKNHQVKELEKGNR
jgi:hypothetical protein